MSLEQVLCKIDFLMVKSSSGKHSFSPSEELDATESCKQAQLFRRKCYNHYSVYYNLTFNKKGQIELDISFQTLNWNEKFFFTDVIRQTGTKEALSKLL